MSQGSVSWEGMGGEQDQVTQAVNTRSTVQVHRRCHALSLFGNLLLVAVWRREHKAQEWTHKAQLRSQFSYLVGSR